MSAEINGEVASSMRKAAQTVNIELVFDEFNTPQFGKILSYPREGIDAVTLGTFVEAIAQNLFSAAESTRMNHALARDEQVDTYQNTRDTLKEAVDTCLSSPLVLPPTRR